MNRSLWALLTGMLVSAAASAAPAAAREASPPPAPRVPLFFEENRGQADASVAFVARSGGAAAFLLRDGISVRTPAGELLALRFEGGAERPAVQGEQPLESRSHYYLGNDPSAWLRDLRHFARVRYREVWPGVDFLLRATPESLAFDLILAPGVDASRIRLGLEGAETLALAPGGELVARQERGDVRLGRPTVYQDGSGGRREIAGRWVAEGMRARFEVGSYDAGAPLVIDPTLTFATWLGGSLNEQGTDVAVDSFGRIWLVGNTPSLDLPTTPGAARPTKGDSNSALSDCFVAKLDPSGGTAGLLYLTYFGGNQSDGCNAIALDGAGEPYVPVTTGSTNFPTTPGVWHTTGFGAAAFKLYADGSLAWSTYLWTVASCGCTGPNAVDIAVGADGQPWIAGSLTISSLSSQAYAIQLTADGADDIRGNSLGSSGSEIANALALDAAGGVWLAGSTTGSLPTANPIQASYGGGASDAFVAHYGSCDPTPPSYFCNPPLQFSTYHGTAGAEAATDVAADGGFGVVVGTGTVPQSPSPLSTTGGGFASAMEPTSATFLYSTQIPSTVSGPSVDVDEEGRAHVVGGGGVGLPLVDPLYTSGSSFALRLSPAGGSIEFSTLLPSVTLNGVYLDPEGGMFLAGTIPNGGSAAFPDVNPVQESAPAGANAAALVLLREVRCVDGSFTLQDTDGDGLYDCWETQGIDANADGVADLALPVLGADPDHKDLFLEIDYMDCAVAGGDCAGGDTHAHAPVPAALEAVRLAFAAAPVANPDGATGIAFHVDATREALAHVESLKFMSSGPGLGDDFDDLKLGLDGVACDGAFGSPADRAAECEARLSARRLAYRYVIFGHGYAEGPTSSGIAELPGNDLMVTQGPESAYAANFMRAVGGMRGMDAGTLMHELGHTLALRHGGGENANCKPNYLSIMSYSRQWSSVLPGRALDYSRQDLPALFEGALDENAGVDGPAVQTAYGVGAAARVAAADSAIDWNGNGSSDEVGISANVNRIDSLGCAVAVLSGLPSYDDWSNLLLRFRSSPDFADGVRITTPEEAELSQAQAEAAAQEADADGDGLPNLDDNCPGVANPAQTDSDGDGHGDACDVCPAVSNSGQEDYDGDGDGDACEVCVTVVNGDQDDSDGDGVPQACDACTALANPALPGPPPAGRTRVSGQPDDDGDGRANACDFDYNGIGLTVTTSDFNDARASQGKPLTLDSCGASVGAGGSGASKSCYVFDHVPGGLTVTVDDFNAAKAAQGKSMSLFPKCAACAPPFSRPLASGTAFVGKPVCEGPACSYGP